MNRKYYDEQQVTRLTDTILYQKRMSGSKLYKLNKLDKVKLDFDDFNAADMSKNNDLSDFHKSRIVYYINFRNSTDCG